MTLEQAWKEEVEEALAGGLPWRLDSVWCSRTSSIRSAGLSHINNGERRTVIVGADAVTPADGKAEIIRQLLKRR